MSQKKNKAQAERAARYYDAVRHVLLCDWDPIGVSTYLDADDEYDSYVWPVCRHIMTSATREQLFNYLRDTESTTMGLSVRNDDHLNMVVDKLFEIRNRLEGIDGSQPAP
jgi:hypothetical protein